MSKRITRLLALLTVLTATAVGIASHNHLGTTVPQGSVATATRNAAIVAATAAVLKETSELRELPILRPVKSGAQSRAEIEKMLVKNLDEQTTPEEMRATQLALRKFGLVPKDFEYRPFIIKLLTEQVAGYYDTKSREFHLVDWLELEGQKPVMAHELTHALQDQHFDLRRFEKWPRGDSDAELAAHALIEGDATLAMTLYLARNPLVALAFSRSISSSGMSSVQFNQAPRALRESLIFPYVQGMEWATEIYKRGGWSMISKAYTRLPQSTEQILHPEKYFSDERPTKIMLPSVTSLLNASSATTSKRQSSVQSAARSQDSRSSWRRREPDVNGEWGYYLILDQFLKSPAESKRAAAGWAGDRYTVYERTGGRNDTGLDDVFIAQASLWDTENEAREFFDAYVKRTVARYPGATPAMLLSNSQNPAPDTVRSWQTNEGGVVIARFGSQVLIIEGVPSGVDATNLIRTLLS